MTFQLQMTQITTNYVINIYWPTKCEHRLLLPETSFIAKLIARLRHFFDSPRPVIYEIYRNVAESVLLVQLGQIYFESGKMPNIKQISGTARAETFYFRTSLDPKTVAQRKTYIDFFVDS